MSIRLPVNYRTIPDLSSERSSTVSGTGPEGVILPIFGLGVGVLIIGVLLAF